MIFWGGSWYPNSHYIKILSKLTFDKVLGRIFKLWNKGVKGQARCKKRFMHLATEFESPFTMLQKIKSSRITEETLDWKAKYWLTDSQCFGFLRKVLMSPLRWFFLLLCAKIAPSTLTIPCYYLDYYYLCDLANIANTLDSFRFFVKTIICKEMIWPRYSPVHNFRVL